MKLTTIWTLPVMSFSTRVYHTKEWFAQTIVEKLSKRIRFWAAMMVISKAIEDMNNSNIDTLTIRGLLDKIEKPKGMH